MLLVGHGENKRSHYKISQMSTDWVFATHSYIAFKGNIRALWAAACTTSNVNSISKRKADFYTEKYGYIELGVEL